MKFTNKLMVVPFKEAVVDPTFPYLSSLDEQMKVVVHSSLKPDEKIKQYNRLLDNFRLGVPDRSEVPQEASPPHPPPLPLQTIKEEKPSYQLETKNIAYRKHIQAQLKKLNSVEQRLKRQLAFEPEFAEENSRNLDRSIFENSRFVDANETLSEDLQRSRLEDSLTRKKKRAVSNALKKITTNDLFAESQKVLPPVRQRKPPSWFSKPSFVT